MEKRANNRISTDQKIVIAYGDEIRSAIISNCSAIGMYVESGASFPLDTVFKIIIPLKDEVLEIPVKVVRLAETEGYIGMSLELLEVSSAYMEFLIRFELGSYS